MVRLFITENAQSFLCRTASEFDKSIFVVVLVSVCEVIRFSSRSFIDWLLFRLAVVVEDNRRIQVVSTKGAIDEPTLGQVQ